MSDKRTSTEPTPDDYIGFGKSLTEKQIAGLLLKFNQEGTWRAGFKDKAYNLPDRAVATVIAPECKIAWQNISTGDFIPVPWHERLSMPLRSTLGDTDPEYWVKYQGKPRDPWTKLFMLPLVVGGTLYTFQTATGGGKGAIGDLMKAYGLGLKNDGQRGRLPRAELDQRPYEHETGKTIIDPVFKIIGWEEDIRALTIFGGLQRPADLIADDGDNFDAPPPHPSNGADEIPWTE